MTTYHYFTSRNEQYFWESSSNYIYQITASGESKTVYEIDYGKNGVPSDFYEHAKYENVVEFLMDTRRRGFHHRHFNVFGNDDYLLFHFDQAEQFATTLFSFSTGKSITFNKIKDDLIAEGDMEDIQLSFFTSFEGENSFIGFVPFEYLENKELLDTELQAGSNHLVFGHFIW
jgi:hypothetical protein